MKGGWSETKTGNPFAYFLSDKETNEKGATTFVVNPYRIFLKDRKETALKKEKSRHITNERLVVFYCALLLFRSIDEFGEILHFLILLQTREQSGERIDLDFAELSDDLGGI